MMVKWPDLMAEFDCWEEAGRVATLWWRDDDAVIPTARLGRLLSIASGVPVSLAVIPADAEQELAQWLAYYLRSAPKASVAVLQHGWRHLNHSGFGKKSEFPAGRPRPEVASELAAGRARLSDLFGTRARPVLVPPWNRFDDSLLGLLAGCGLTGISRARARSASPRVPGVIEANIHVDLVAWKESREFVGQDAALGGLVRHLRARRLRAVCEDEPTGILTHHLVQDEVTHAFLDRLIAVSVAHPAVLWLDAGEIFGSDMRDLA
jgi:peptidoglycan/xylan/chitin deacetylase (PgdA/CDA1 family)